MSSQVGFFSKKNANCLFDTATIDSVFEDQFGKETPSSVRNEVPGTKANDILKDTSK
jgi:hypothetical protein